jgi:N-acetylneuraminate synthase
MATVRIGDRYVGEGQACYLIGEIGINHNGDVEIAKKLIELAKASGCDAVKFQKRTPDLCVPRNQRDIPRETPWGLISYIEYKKKVEFSEEEYSAIDACCRSTGITWFASCWDIPSVDFLERFSPPCYKIPSASLTDDELLEYTASKGRPILLSTGMSTLEQIDHAVALLPRESLIVLQACSTYPAPYEELNLRVIPALRDRYGLPVGYSGHESGIASTVAAVALGAAVIERHITLDRSMWGTDQAASLGPSGLQKLVRDIRLVETALGDGQKRVFESEVAVMKKLRLR